MRDANIDMQHSNQDEQEDYSDEDGYERIDVEDGEEKEYDPFAEETFDDPDMQKCWLILGKLYYHYEVTDFLEPVTLELFGDDQKLYEEYCSIVTEPMDISTIMAKMRADEYPSKHAFRRDVQLIFDNCREFNEEGTEIYHCANSLNVYFTGLWHEFGMY